MSTFCALNQLQRARVFLSDNVGQIQIEHKEAVLRLGNMMIAFANMDYDLVIEEYIVSSFKIPSHRLHAAGLFLRASFEQKGNDEYYFDAHLRNILDFIRRQSQNLSVKQVEAWKNFVRIMRMLVNNTPIKKIEKTLEQKTNTIHRKWIVAKIEGRVTV